MWKKILIAFGLILVLIVITIGGIFGRSLGDTAFEFLSIRGALASPSPVISQMQTQQIEDLNIKYPSPFSLNEADSKDMMSSLPLNAKNQIRMLSVYNSEPTCGIGEIRIIRVIYAHDVELNIDSTVAGGIKQISTLDGIGNFENSISSIKVSGYPARKISFNSNRWGGVLGGEFLFIEDKDLKTIWQLQLLFGSKNSNHETLNDARFCANEIFKNISIRNRTVDYGALIDEMSEKCELVFDGQTNEECCIEKNLKNCPSPQPLPIAENEYSLTKEVVYVLGAIAILTIVTIFIAFRKRWIQNLSAYLSETTKAAFTGWIIWIFIVMSYVVLLSPHGYIDDDLKNIALWCTMPPLLAFAVYLWVKRFIKSKN